MKKSIKRGIAFGVLCITCVIGFNQSNVFAASQEDTPVGIVSDLSGETIDSLRQMRLDTNKTYGQIAMDLNVYDQFKERMTEARIQNLQERVSEGTLQQEQADEAITRMYENQANCDGSGSGQPLRDGSGSGQQLHDGSGSGQQLRDGSGSGQPLHDGSGSRDGTGQGSQGARGQGMGK